MKRFTLILLLIVISFPLWAEGGSLDSAAIQIDFNLEQVLEMKICDQSIHRPGAEGWESLEPIQYLNVKPGENKQIWALVMTNTNLGFTFHVDAPNLTSEGNSTQIRYMVGAFNTIISYTPPTPPENQDTYVTYFPAPGEGMYPADHQYGIPHGLRIMGRGFVFTLFPEDYEQAVEGFYTAEITVTLVVD